MQRNLSVRSLLMIERDDGKARPGFVPDRMENVWKHMVVMPTRFLLHPVPDCLYIVLVLCFMMGFGWVELMKRYSLASCLLLLYFYFAVFLILFLWRFVLDKTLY